MTRTEIERLVAVEEKLASVERNLDSLTIDVKNTASKDDIRLLADKLDAAIECKADKSAVEDIADIQRQHDNAISRLYGALALAAVGVPVALWLIERAFK